VGGFERRRGVGAVVATRLQPAAGLQRTFKKWLPREGDAGMEAQTSIETLAARKPVLVYQKARLAAAAE
jgi:hypothetical protein